MNNVFIKDKKGQAILELAIFGAILIMLLGALINYGLRYNYQQLAMQRAFRKALGTSATSSVANMPVSVMEWSGPMRSSLNWLKIQKLKSRFMCSDHWCTTMM